MEGRVEDLVLLKALAPALFKEAGVLIQHCG